MAVATLVCAECSQEAQGRARGWRCCIGLEEDGETDFAVVFCPDCWTHEFEPLRD